jgi:predicted metalloprotease with PDZ domain
VRPLSRRICLALFLLVCACVWAQPPVDYYVALADARHHVVHVRIHLAGTSAERDLQLPAWNALYQIRDFSQYVLSVSARTADGRKLPVRKLDKQTWRVSGAEAGLEFEYDIYADNPGPYGAQLGLDHAFFNLAEILMYPLDGRDAPATVTFSGVPAGWKISTPLPRLNPGDDRAAPIFAARNYDRLVDGPVELGTFREKTFDEGGATYHVVVDADPKDYDMEALAAMVRKIVAAETSWMQDRPFTEYWFIYHFPRAPGGGGMEHAYSTAIEVSADRLSDDNVGVAGVTAHEFFHLWNVKRIRPRSLAPIDYTRENYTRALWFAEGVTSSVEAIMLTRAGITDEGRFLVDLSHEIRNLQLRPAHLTQSVEESSLDTWLDKYPDYRMPERSISYYNKGEILGLLLDLAVRDATGGRRSLRDVFQWMNVHDAHLERYYDDSEGVREAVAAVTGKDFKQFFRDYVAGTAELPYNDFFRTVGLQLDTHKIVVPNPGFQSVRNFDQAPVVVWVDDGSDAQRAGLEAGDRILKVNGRMASDDLSNMIAGIQPGETLKLRVQGRKGNREVRIKLGGSTQEDFKVTDLPQVTPEQRARRRAWLSGEDQGEEGAATP